MTYQLAGGSTPLVVGTGQWAGTQAAVPPTKRHKMMVRQNKNRQITYAGTCVTYIYVLHIHLKII